MTLIIQSQRSLWDLYSFVIHINELPAIYGTMNEIKTFFLDNEFLQDICSALIGTGTAFAIFYITIRADKKKEKENLKRQANNRIRNFKNLISSSINHAETTISNLEEMINQYDTNLLDFQLLRFAPNKSFDRLDELLKNEEYFQAYTTKYGKDNVDNYNRLSLIIDYFFMQLNQLWEMVEKSQNFDYQRKPKFKEQSNDILNQIAKITITPDTGISREHIDLLGSYLVEFHNGMTNETGLQYLYDFNRKCLEVVLRNYIGNNKAMQVIELIRESSVLFNEIQQQNNGHKKDLVEIKNEMINSLEIYKNLTQNLQ